MYINKLSIHVGDRAFSRTPLQLRVTSYALEFSVINPIQLVQVQLRHLYINVIVNQEAEPTHCPKLPRQTLVKWCETKHLGNQNPSLPSTPCRHTSHFAYTCARRVQCLPKTGQTLSIWNPLNRSCHFDSSGGPGALHGSHSSSALRPLQAQDPASFVLPVRSELGCISSKEKRNPPHTLTHGKSQFLWNHAVPAFHSVRLFGIQTKRS